MTKLESYFEPFRRNIVGWDQTFKTAYGEQRIVYADWTASGRLYRPIEERIAGVMGPFVGNTHTEASVTGTRMTQAYHKAREIIKRHVGAGPDDVVLTPGFGLTAAINKFQRILGLKVPDQLRSYLEIPDEMRPVVFVTHMEHHSNHTSWLETLADVVVIPADEQGLCDVGALQGLLDEYRDREMKIGSFISCSNVTGIRTPVHTLAKIMHQNGGVCFVDCAAQAPYEKIDMHPADPMEKLDAVIFSPHKFLGGPGSSGVLVFDSKLYDREVPDHPGGGTVDWTNPWGGRRYLSSIEDREDGGTPGFLQAIRTALAIQLKEQMGVSRILEREHEIVRYAFDELRKIPGMVILADNIEDRLAVFSFYVERVHYNLIVKLLNDRFGVQVRGGCLCAGTYGHYLLQVGAGESKCITDMIDQGDLSQKPGWVRLSFHPTTTDDELEYAIDAVGKIVRNHAEWRKEYDYSASLNEYIPLGGEKWSETDLAAWFEFEDE
jgi:selenocysteine lyase/cysteine desulfurase